MLFVYLNFFARKLLILGFAMLELCSDFTWLSNLFNPKTGTFFSRYSVFKGDNASLMTIGAGLCSKSDPDYCPSFVTLLDNAILRIPKCLSDGSFEWPTGKDVFLVSRLITLVFSVCILYS